MAKLQEELDNMIEKSFKMGEQVAVYNLSNEILRESIDFFKTHDVIDRRQLAQILERSRNKLIDKIGV